MTTAGKRTDTTMRRIRRQQGDTMRNLRQMRGLSMSDLAITLHVTEGAVGHWERGLYSPRQDTQLAIARALDTSWTSIFAIDEDQQAAG